MDLRRRPGLLLSLLGIVAVLAAAMPAVAQAAVPPTVTVLQPDCIFDEVTGGPAPTLATDGTVQGYNTYDSFDAPDTCGGRLFWFRADPATRTLPFAPAVVQDQNLVPVQGRILGQPAQDGLDTVVLVSRKDAIGTAANEGGIVVVKHFHTTNSFGIRKVSNFIGGAELPTGSIDAAGGGWWAVWAEQEAGNEFAPSHVYEAHDVFCGGNHLVQSRRRMTRIDASDREPSIQLLSGGCLANIVWSRDSGPETGDLRLSAAAPRASWTPSRVVTHTHLGHRQPQLRISGGNRLVAWTRQSRVAVGRLPGGGSLSLDFLGTGHLSFGFALTGRIGFIVSTGDTGHVLFTSNRSGHWGQKDLVPVNNNQALGVVDTPGPGVAVEGASFSGSYTSRSYLVFGA
jgi:hypothetical protein